MRCAFPFIFLILTLFLFAVPGHARSRPDSATFREVWHNVNNRMEANKARKIEEGKVIVSPAVIPGYTPELRFMISGGGIISWTNNRQNKQLPRSNMAVGFALSTTGAMVINLRPVTFWANDRFRLNAGFWHKNMPDHYWGVGYLNGYETPESDSTTAYRRRWFQFKVDALVRVKGGLFAGPTFDLNHTRGSGESEGVASDPYYIRYNDKPLNTGLGALLRYDSRDVTVNAWKGLYLDAQVLFYGPWLGGDNSYRVAMLDYRHYRRINSRDGRVLAWQLISRMTFGEVPYGEMSQLGSPFGLRGYHWGRYRDKSMTYLMAEYRHTFVRGNGNLSRHGAVAWLGAGSIYDLENTGYSSGAGTNRLLPNAGLGYRLEVQPRLNMRLDFGVGRETTGFYFNIVEAF